MPKGDKTLKPLPPTKARVLFFIGTVRPPNFNSDIVGTGKMTTFKKYLAIRKLTPSVKFRKGRGSSEKLNGQCFGSWLVLGTCINYEQTEHSKSNKQYFQPTR